MNHNNHLNTVVAVAVSILIILGWQYFYTRPQNEYIKSQQAIYKKNKAIQKVTRATTVTPKILDRQESISQSNRVYFSNNIIKGSINLRGSRIDDLVLLKYRQTTSPDSPYVILLSPSNTIESSFVDIGWGNNHDQEDLPDSNSLWTANKHDITIGETVTLEWKNKNNVTFHLQFTIDDSYLIHIVQKVYNRSDKNLYLQNYGLVNKVLYSQQAYSNIIHEGAVGCIGSKLEEKTFKQIKNDKQFIYNNSDISWIGMTEKYWLTSFIPTMNKKYLSSFSYGSKNARERYQVDFVHNHLIASGAEYQTESKLFIGPKKIELLQQYQDEYNIKMFDRAVDFGWLYVLTKPLFYTLNFFYQYTGNFGVSILIVTVLLKLLMFGLANKSYKSMNKIKALQPDIERLKDLYGDDKAKYHQEIMLLYKKQRVNPISGCLPMIVQIPVFFALYKVLSVTIEMRHAPFFGWIHDLSAPDPTNIFNLFGLLSFSPPSYLHISAWTILMVVTMYIQQAISPKPTDPTQEQIMKLMPLVFLFVFNSFPAGLVIYWTWSNILSIAQQYYINNRVAKDK